MNAKNFFSKCNAVMEGLQRVTAFGETAGETEDEFISESTVENEDEFIGESSASANAFSENTVHSIKSVSIPEVSSKIETLVEYLFDFYCTTQLVELLAAIRVIFPDKRFHTMNELLRWFSLEHFAIPFAEDVDLMNIKIELVYALSPSPIVITNEVIKDVELLLANPTHCPVFEFLNLWYKNSRKVLLHYVTSPCYNYSNVSSLANDESALQKFLQRIASLKDIPDWFMECGRLDEYNPDLFTDCYDYVLQSDAAAVNLNLDKYQYSDGVQVLVAARYEGRLSESDYLQYLFFMVKYNLAFDFSAGIYPINKYWIQRITGSIKLDFQCPDDMGSLLIVVEASGKTHLLDLTLCVWSGSALPGVVEGAGYSIRALRDNAGIIVYAKEKSNIAKKFFDTQFNTKNSLELWSLDIERNKCPIPERYSLWKILSNIGDDNASTNLQRFLECKMLTYQTADVAFSLIVHKYTDFMNIFNMTDTLLVINCVLPLLRARTGAEFLWNFLRKLLKHVNSAMHIMQGSPEYVNSVCVDLFGKEYESSIYYFLVGLDGIYEASQNASFVTMFYKSNKILLKMK